MASAVWGSLVLLLECGINSRDCVKASFGRRSNRVRMKQSPCSPQKDWNRFSSYLKLVWLHTPSIGRMGQELNLGKNCVSWLLIRVLRWNLKAAIPKDWKSLPTKRNSFWCRKSSISHTRKLWSIIHWEVRCTSQLMPKICTLVV